MTHLAYPSDTAAARPPEFQLPGDDRSLPQGVTQVIARLEADIIHGRILPSARLIEDHLMEDYGAKRHVVRSALEELGRLGVVVKPRHRGAELRRFDRAEIDQLYHMRTVLQRAAVRLMTTPKREQLELLELCRQTHLEAARSYDVVAVHRANMMFHATLNDICGNPFLSESIRRYDWVSFPIRAHGVQNRAALEQACEEHRLMVELLEAGDLEALEELTVSHMSFARRIYEDRFCPPPQ